MAKVESQIQSDIQSYLRGLPDAYVVNIGGGASTAKGTPDLLVCYKGKFIALEVKRPDSSYGLTKPQTIRIVQIKKAGGIAQQVESITDVANLLRTIKE